MHWHRSTVSVVVAFIARQLLGCRLSLAIGASAMMLAACGGGSGWPPPAQAGTPSPAITAAPQSIALDAGGSTTLSVTATGTAPLSYQWRKDGQPIGGATSDSLTISDAAVDHAGSYTVVVSNAAGSVTSSPAQVSVTKTLLVDDTYSYLRLGHLRLKEVDPQLAAQSDLTLTHDSGPAMEAKLDARQFLHFLSPPEQNQYTETTLKLADKSGLRVWKLRFQWVTRAGKTLTRIIEADENGKAPADDGATISVSGVGKDGFIGPSFSGLSYKITGFPDLSPEWVFAGLETRTGTIKIESYFTLDPAAGTLTLRPDRVATLLAAVRESGVALIHASASPRHEEGIGFVHTLIYANGKLTVQVRNADETAVTDLAGTRFVARGFDTNTTAIATLDAKGELLFSGLRPDTYEVREVRLGNGLSMVGFATLPTVDAEATLTIYRRPAPSSSPSGSTIGSKSVVTAGDLPPEALRERAAASRPVTKARLQARIAASTPPNAVYSLSAVADAKGLIVEKTVNYQIPKGTSKIGVRIEVYSEEYPHFTQTQSKYNDVWLYDLRLPAGSPLQQSGKVNQTHVAAGTLTVERCLDVSELTKDAPAPLTGSIGAQNVADDLLPTMVTLWVSTSCKLAITHFEGKSTAADGQFLLVPQNTADGPAARDRNIAGQYLSLPMAAALPASFGIPSTLKFEPSDATITEIELFQRASTGDSSLGKAYLDQDKPAQPGELKFASLSLQPTALTPLSERVQIVAVLRGTLPSDSTPVDSDPMELTVDKQWSSFTPIYLSSELTAYQAARRYGTHNEAGGDSWSTLAMANWLFNAGLRYNDVSAANVKQTASGRSVLDHAGHSDAQQADLRYWDGSGGFTDMLGGANEAQGLANLAAAARAEIQANAADRPSLTRLTAWITQNRANLSAYAARAEVRGIYIGLGHVTDLLVNGVFPRTSAAVPGIQPWDTRPGIIAPQPGHLNHWHVNTSNP